MTRFSNCKQWGELLSTWIYWSATDFRQVIQLVNWRLSDIKQLKWCRFFGRRIFFRHLFRQMKFFFVPKVFFLRIWRQWWPVAWTLPDKCLQLVAYTDGVWMLRFWNFLHCVPTNSVCIFVRTQINLVAYSHCFNWVNTQICCLSGALPIRKQKYRIGITFYRCVDLLLHFSCKNMLSKQCNRVIKVW